MGGPNRKPVGVGGWARRSKGAFFPGAGHGPEVRARFHGNPARSPGHGTPVFPVGARGFEPPAPTVSRRGWAIWHCGNPGFFCESVPRENPRRPQRTPPGWATTWATFRPLLGAPYSRDRPCPPPEGAGTAGIRSGTRSFPRHRRRPPSPRGHTTRAPAVPAERPAEGHKFQPTHDSLPNSRTVSKRLTGGRRPPATFGGRTCLFGVPTPVRESGSAAGDLAAKSGRERVSRQHRPRNRGCSPGRGAIVGQSGLPGKRRRPGRGGARPRSRPGLGGRPLRRGRAAREGAGGPSPRAAVECRSAKLRAGNSSPDGPPR